MITVEEFRDLLEFHYTSTGIFRGYDCLGYIGNSMRNYLTDQWVHRAANDLGWTLVELAVWLSSVEGRFAIEAAPADGDAMRDLMARTDVGVLVGVALCLLLNDKEET